MTNKTPAQEALEDYKMRKASGFNLEGMGAWVWQNEKEIIRSLNILKAIESGELESIQEKDITKWRGAWVLGYNQLLNRLKKIGEQK